MSNLSIPTHVGFIVDGNRRYAREHGLPSLEGHLAGYKALKKVVTAAVDKGVSYISLYVFSTENWQRSEEEVSYLMALSLQVFREDLDELVQNQIRVKVLGSRHELSQELVEAIDDLERRTAHLTRGTLCLCFNYGGRREIADAVQAALADGIAPQDITEEAISAHLYSPDVPDIDIMVRTSGEQRISNFMLWRLAYAELMFLDKLWPHMLPADVDAVIEEFNRRNRRFGGN